MKKSARIQVGLLLSLGCIAAQGQTIAPSSTTVRQFWPEFNTYIGLPSNMALVGRAAIARSRDSGEGTWEIGANLSRNFQPILRPLFPTDSPDEGRYLTLLCGYSEIGSHTLESRDEHRGVLSATGRYPLPAGFVIANRNRLDLRGLQDFSWRYRNQLTLRHGLVLGHHNLTTYAKAEAFYDSAFSRWNRFSYQGGVVIPLARNLEFDSYFEHQKNSGVVPGKLDAIGVTLIAYVR